MAKSARLSVGLAGSGLSRIFTNDAPTLPAEFDQKVQSLAVRYAPVAFFDQQNYQGQALVITRAGGCDDLAVCVPAAGNWRNRIRSIKFPPGGSVVPNSTEVELPNSAGYKDDDK